jgi:hypothetical protein
VKKPCPQEHLHTEAPQGYLPWVEWAEKMSKTHVQEKCPGCGLFKIWRPKEPDER